MAGKERGRRGGFERRCLVCGHPKVEHRVDAKCTVPKCICDQYKAAFSVAEAPEPT